MFIIIGCVLLVICFIVAISIFRYNEEKAGLLPPENIKKIESLKSKFLIFLLAGATCIIMSIVLANTEGMITSKMDYTVNDTVEIYALKDKTSKKGTFYLGSGSVDNKTYYCYYILTKDGYMYDTISPQDYSVYLNYINYDERPHIDTLYKTKTNIIDSKYYWLVSVKALLNPEEYKIGTIVSTKKYPLFVKYKIYVPEGTIDKNYKIDME